MTRLHRFAVLTTAYVLVSAIMAACFYKPGEYLLYWMVSLGMVGPFYLALLILPLLGGSRPSGPMDFSDGPGSGVNERGEIMRNGVSTISGHAMGQSDPWRDSMQ